MRDGAQTVAKAPGGTPPGPREVRTAEELTKALEMLRRRAARGTRRARISLDDIAARTAVPRSTVHSYLHGVRLPPPDVLDAIVVALGASPPEQREWAEALERCSERTPSPPTIGPAPHLLPMAPQGFVAREAELDVLHRRTAPAWSDPPAPAVLVSLCGTGGVGKTALALTFAHQVAPHFPDGQLWLDLCGFGPNQPVDPLTALTRLLIALGVDPSTMEDDLDVRAGAYRSVLDGRRVLVVLDNARDAAQVRALLPGSPGCATLVTSRSNLNSLVVSEGAHRVKVGRLSSDDATLLARTDLEATTLDTGSVTTTAETAYRVLVDACEGLPLALRILRERLAGTSEEALVRLADQVADRRNRLRELDLGEDGGTVTAVIASSYEALPADLARVLRRIALVGVSSIQVEVAAVASGTDAVETTRQLERLAARSLLDPVGDGSYRLHDLLAAFVGTRPDDDEPADVARAVTALASYYHDHMIVLSQIVNPRHSAAPNSGALHRFSSLAAATQWVVAALPAIAGLAESSRLTDDPHPVWELVDFTFHLVQDHVDTTPLTAVFAAVAADALRRGDVVGECRLRQLEGTAASGRGDIGMARTSFERAVTLSEDGDDPSRQAEAVGNLARLELRSGRLTRALELQEQALGLRRRAGHEDDPGALAALADLHLQVGDMDVSRALRARVLRLAREQCDPHLQATSLYHLGGIALSCDDLPGARDAAAGCTAAATQAGVSSALLCARLLAAAVALATGDLDEAGVHVRGARTVPVSETAEQTVDLHVIAGRVAAASGDPAGALAEHRIAVQVSRQLAQRFQETIALLNLARSLRRVGQLRDARAEVQQARALAGACGFVRLEGRATDLLEKLG